MEVEGNTFEFAFGPSTTAKIEFKQCETLTDQPKRWVNNVETELLNLNDGKPIRFVCGDLDSYPCYGGFLLEVSGVDKPPVAKLSFGTGGLMLEHAISKEQARSFLEGLVKHFKSNVPALA